jgi:FkbM family methyltransferase
MYKKYLLPRYILERIKSQDHKIRFLLSRLLWVSRLCNFFIIKLSHGIIIRFYPTSTSTALWFDPKSFDAEGVDFIWDYLKKDDIFLDVGANIGEMTLVAAKKAVNGKVFSIEAHPKIFKFLNKNIKLNNFKNIKTYNFAAGEKNCAIKISNIRSDDQNFISEKGVVDIEMKKIDDMNFEKIDLMKLDVEGYELPVLRGAVKTLPVIKAIYFESYPTNFRRYGYGLKDILGFLFSNNFKVFRFSSKKDLQEINLNYNSEDCENLLAVRK